MPLLLPSALYFRILRSFLFACALNVACNDAFGLSSGRPRLPDYYLVHPISGQD
ncbi:hypothetical protein M409DRAFT_31205 [Zasmidium cellare ATCC 36951]|uniref:Lipoprotein n=1 Tax=Zasmidium cellare ATCC 36951 TaxID=1080233 RepID=A0A6A6BXM7_ZASCE|nr:uncharacterized protein M409DRAFT_31205 [Zasmidium cellare ATCC 36951]KAF2158289.1 hypothetical protein M409DRAFT_31205 [Zasmidium cellare ATCC 36951]